FQVFQLAQSLGLTPEKLYGLNNNQWSRLLRETESFSETDRRRIFHLAFERRLLTRSLDAIAVHSDQAAGRSGSAKTRRFQAVFCIDEREESIRRHLEEVAPDCETFGTAGFFAAPIYYRGVADAHFVALCPPVMRPQHWVVEKPAD